MQTEQPSILRQDLHASVRLQGLPRGVVWFSKSGEVCCVLRKLHETIDNLLRSDVPPEMGGKRRTYFLASRDELRLALYKVNASGVPDAPVTEEGSKGARIQWLINEKDGAPTFLMRQFTLEPGGFTPYHKHEWEHEVFVLEGQGKVRYETREEAIHPGDAILIPPGKTHQFQAGSVGLKFLCMVPK